MAVQDRDLMTRDSRELVLAHNEYAYFQDDTKGQVTTLTGPHTKQLGASEKPVIFNSGIGRFDRIDNIQQAVSLFPFAPEGSYLILENPATDDGKAHPTTGQSFLPEISWGRKVNLPGPVTFALWPGQRAQVVSGHHLRSNQYILVRVYNDLEARANWAKSVVRRVTVVEPPKPDTQQTGGEEKPSQQIVTNEVPADLTMGRLFVIKGTEVSFYIPPTGMEVVPDESGSFVREALTLERLQHCILLSEGGNKRFVRGPAVVFPEPTETFVESTDNNRKFRAIELNDDMGLFVKVTEPYEENGKQYNAGDELFITGGVQRLYFPRAEHNLIRYGAREVHYGIAIPTGEARYVLDKQAGDVQLVKGPKIFLPDPRTETIVRRVLSADEVNLWFPNSPDAAKYNDSLREILQRQKSGPATRPLEESSVRSMLGQSTTRGTRQAVDERSVTAYGGDSFDRGTAFTPPRTITLDTKYEGAVAINVWNGYAVMVADKLGNQRVEVGPKTVLLEYDETLVPLALSTGKPKNQDDLLRTVYLRTLYNYVTDIVEVVTADDVRASVKIVWRVNFEGDPSKWFSVENYVKFLCDRTRSILRWVAKKLTIQELNRDHISIIRDAILGQKPEDGSRIGLMFAENGAHVYDVEVAELVIGDKAIADLLNKVQTESVNRAINLSRQEREYQDTLKIEDLKRRTAEALAETERHASDLSIRKATVVEDAKKQMAEIADGTKKHAAALLVEETRRTEDLAQQAEMAKAETASKRIEIATAGLTESLGLDLKKADADREKAKKTEEARLAAARAVDEVAAINLAVAKRQADHELELNAREQNLRIEELKAQVQAFVDRMKAFAPEMASALQAFSDKDMATRLANAVAPLALAESQSIDGILRRVFAGTQFGAIIEKMTATVPVSERN